MQRREIIIRHAEGVHTRPASVFVREAGKFRSQIHLTVDKQTVNGKSIMGLLMLAMGKGTKVILTAEGEDENQAAEKLASVLEGEF